MGTETFAKNGKASKFAAKKHAVSHKLASMDDKWPGGVAPVASRQSAINNYGKTAGKRSHGGVIGDGESVDRTISYNGDKFGTGK